MSESSEASRTRRGAATRSPAWAGLCSLLCGALLAGCAITIREPVAATAVPTPVKVVVTGNASYSNFRLLANGIDVTQHMAATGNNAHEGSLALPAGVATLQASADVYCWYCTGSSTPSQQTLSFTVLSSHAFMDIDAGESHTCAVDATNKAWCWGDNSHGQLGSGPLPDLSCSLDPTQPQRPCRPNPVQVAGGQAFVAVAAGQAHSCGLSTAGQVFCWGRNDRGQLGDGTQTSSRVPVQVVHPATFKAVSTGDAHSCALALAGELFCWGDNGRGQLGVQGVSNCPTGTGTGCSPVPVRQGTGIPGTSFLFTELSAGSRHTCASSLQTIKCWGNNDEGQLGVGTFGPASGGPNATIAVAGQFISYATPAGTHIGPGLSAGFAHTCAFRAAGSGASCWGDNFSGQLGASWPATRSPVPAPVAVSSGQVMTGLSAGFQHSCALKQAVGGGKLQPVCAGYNGSGQLGNGSRVSSNSFTAVAFSVAAGQDFFKLSVGKGHSCALSVTGRSGGAAGGTDFIGAAYCWGDNTYGQVGQSFEGQWLTPAEVHIP